MIGLDQHKQFYDSMIALPELEAYMLSMDMEGVPFIAIQNEHHP